MAQPSLKKGLVPLGLSYNNPFIMTVSLTQTQITLIGIAAIASILAIGLTVHLQASFAQENATTVVTTDDFLASTGGLIAAISTLVSTVVGIVVYVVNAIRSKTGDKIVSTDLYNKFVDAVGIIQQKDNELRDVYRQVLEHKETIKVAFDVLKSTNPEVAKKLDESLPVANKAIQNQILPQISQWQTQSDRVYETLLKKEPVVK